MEAENSVDVVNETSGQPAPDAEQIIHKFKVAIIDRLKLTVTPEEMAHDVPLFGEGLGLDSVDALLMALVIETEFEVEVSDNDIFEFQSLNDVAAFIINGGGNA